LAALAGICGVRSFAAGAHLLRGGEQAVWSFCLTAGLVREYYVDEDGGEHTRSFVAAGELTGSLRDLLSGEPSVTFIEALEPTEVIAWRYADMLALYDAHPAIERAARRAAEALYVKKARREHEMLALGAEARHRQFLERHPALVARVSQRHLASYLGITPEHLSRLRGRRGRSVPRSG
jgi:CRP-like cAMP-binding protein